MGAGGRYRGSLVDDRGALPPLLLHLLLLPIVVLVLVLVVIAVLQKSIPAQICQLLFILVVIDQKLWGNFLLPNNLEHAKNAGQAVPERERLLY